MRVPKKPNPSATPTTNRSPMSQYEYDMSIWEFHSKQQVSFNAMTEKMEINSIGRFNGSYCIHDTC